MVSTIHEFGTGYQVKFEGQSSTGADFTMRVENCGYCSGVYLALGDTVARLNKQQAKVLASVLLDMIGTPQEELE